MKAGDSQVVQDLACFMAGDLVDCFCIHYNLVEDDQVGNVLTDLHGPIQYVVSRLLPKGNPALGKLNTHGVLIRLFQQAVPKRIENLISDKM